MKSLLSTLAAAGALLFAWAVSAETPAYVGSKACAGCHVGAAAAWKGSHHAWAWNLPNETTVLGDFDDAIFEHKGVTTRFSTRDGRYLIETDGADGTRAEFEVAYTAGVAPLQQYLVETEPGRLQALDVAWDSADGRWYHLYPDQDLRPGDGLHWTGPYKNWNGRCAECHATGYDKAYDARSRSFASTQSEIGVGCEACHGPGSVHLARAAASTAFAPAPGLTSFGFAIDLASGSAETQIQLCAGCHARREPLGGISPLPGTAFHDSYRLALLREGLYHADGSIQDEVYVYGSFLQSKMYAQGIRCSDCHDSHTASLKTKGNAVCTQCHSPRGNPRFPTLRSGNYDDPSHHFHAAGSEGARCVSCHMIERVYMGIDGRRDHSFRIPRPDLSIETGAPNACTDCHAERGVAWAGAEIARRFPDSDRRGSHFSGTFAAARDDPTAVAEDLLEIALQSKLPGIVRASALDLVRPAADAGLAARVAWLIGDDDPLVRRMAIALQRGAPPAKRIERLLPALEDRARTVRIAAAREFLDTPAASLGSQDATALRRAMNEWRASLFAKADFPETHMVTGGTALLLRNSLAAEQAFREAARLDPQLVDAWIMIARIRAATGDPDGAEDALNRALAIEPMNQVLLGVREELRETFGR